MTDHQVIERIIDRHSALFGQASVSDISVIETSSFNLVFLFVCAEKKYVLKVMKKGAKNEFTIIQEAGRHISVPSPLSYGEIDDDEYTLQPLERILCPLGFATAIPEGYYAAVVPRSGLALWQGLSIVNSPGTIDSGYRNEWGAIVVNLSKSPVTLHKGDKICQLIIRKLVDYEFEEVETLPTSERGLGGFGSTGK